MSAPVGGKTELRRLEQYRDRWSSYDEQSGLVGLSERLSVEKLREYELFADFDDRLLERIASDVSLAVWKPGSVLFEQGAYIDLAFCVAEGEVEVYVEGVGEEGAEARPIFDLSRTMIGELVERLYEGDALAMVSHLLNESEFDEQELQRLKRLIEARGREKEPMRGH